MKSHAEEISSEYDALSEHGYLLSPSSNIFEDLSISAWNEAECPGLHSSTMPFAIHIKTKGIH